MAPPLWQKLKMKVKEESEKAQHSENKDHGIQSHHFMENRWGNSGNSVRLYFWGAPKSLQMVTAAMKLKELKIEVEQLKGPGRIIRFAEKELGMSVARSNIYVKAGAVKNSNCPAVLARN